MGSGLAVLLIAVPLLVATGAVITLVNTIERATVSRARLAMFARRHRLTVTVDNGHRLIRYLATTRRWRVVGLVAGLVYSVGSALSHRAISINFLTLFAGWFVGALVAEIRLARTAFGPRRAASLTARVPAMYLPRFAWWLVPVLAAVSVVVAGIAVVARLRDSSPGPATWVLGGIAVAIAIVVNRVQRQVLRRPQPVEAPDLVAADDAIRSRSLHVLTGGGMTLVLYCVLGQLAALKPLVDPGSPPSVLTQAIGAGTILGIFVVPIAGWIVATASWRVARPDGTVELL
jgi:hypothetical protein